MEYEVYEFFRTRREQIENQGSPFASPLNVKSNLVGNAVGIFVGVTVGDVEGELIGANDGDDVDTVTLRIRLLYVSAMYTLPLTETLRLQN